MHRLRSLIVPLLALTLVGHVSAALPGEGADDGGSTKPKVVEIVITANSSEEPTLDNPLGPTRRNFRSKLEQLRDVAADPAIAGVTLNIKSTPGYAKSLDLLEELRAVKDAGKKIVCYTEMLTRSDAMISSISDVLVVPPSGMIIMEGLLAESMYLKEMFAKLDVRFEVLHIGDFKTAYEDFAKDEMSDGQRATIESILGEYYEQMINTLAENRGMAPEGVEAVFEKMFVAPSEAVQMGLIDAAVYKDEYDAKVEQLFGGKVEVVKGYGERTKEDIEKMLESPFAIFTLLPTLLNPPEVEAPDEPYVGVVYASGAIMSGKSKSDMNGNVSQMGSDTIVAALDKVRKDDNCKAVVLRVNSPGGSALASDMIWRAVERVREAGKPVVSSMGSVAASGGYWISMGCDAIVAQPSTITGSIGVVSMLPDLSETMKTMGINVQTVSKGPWGDDMSLLKDGPSDKLKKTMTHWMKDVYGEFIQKVADGRGMDPDRVHELAQGRAWTGREAEAVGLVDELGGLQDALDLAATLGGLGSDAPLLELPDVPNFLEQIEEAMQGAVRVQTPVEELLETLGFEHLLQTARTAMKDVRAFSPDRIQAVLPFEMVIR